MAFNLCLDADKIDGPLQYMSKLMDKTKAMAPEEWKGAFDCDLKPEPPEFDLFEAQEEAED